LTIDLHADCSQCFALCCVALPFTKSADFAIDKPAGTPCRNLDAFACTIHDRLPLAGFPGCAAYDCFGAGQRIAQQTFRGIDWRSHPESAELMFAAFVTMRHLHELLWLITSALGRPEAEPLRADLQANRSAVERAADSSAAELAEIDVNELRSTAAPLLRQVSRLVRGEGARDLSGADLTGADLRNEHLRNADLRNATLLGANLKGVDLGRADLLGADLRSADLAGADLAGTLYLTQSQLGAGRGDDATRIPSVLRRPLHWAMG
jgi:uncharacterized protein YjbI with pentapeptide repeats